MKRQRYFSGCARALGALLAICVVAAHGQMSARADTWPSRPIRFVVGYPAGGGADVMARLFAEPMSRTLGQRIFVENRTGAGGTLGASSVARAEPDGHTFYVAAISEISIAPAVVKSLPYDPLKDFKPVILFSQWPQILVASPSFPPSTLAELIAYGKENPGKLSYSSFGVNTINHVNGERFKLASGISAVHVPYRGSGPSLVDVMAGQIHYTFDSPAATANLIRSGKLKAIAVAGTERLSSLNTIPTMAEAGMPFVINSWVGLLAPASTPQSTIDRLNEAANAAMKSPEVRQVMENNNTQPAGGTPQAFGEQIRAEIAEYRQIVSQTGISPQ